MNIDTAPAQINESLWPVLRKLRAVRRREQGVRLVSGLLKVMAGLLALVLVAMLIDTAFVIFSPAVRWGLAMGTAVLTLAAVVLWILRPLLQRRKLDRVARSVDSAVPELEERWSTVSSIRSGEDLSMTGAPSLVKRVCEEAGTYAPRVESSRIVSKKSVGWAGMTLVVLGSVLVVWFALDSERVGVLLQRLLMPGADVSLTRLNATLGDSVVPRGEPLLVSAGVNGRVPSNGQLMIRTQSGERREIPLTLGDGKFAHQLEAVREAFAYRFRAGDGQTAWHRIGVVDRPKITAIQFQLTPPEYTQLPVVQETALPRRIRVVQGTMMKVGFQSDQPLSAAELEIQGGEPQLLARQGGWYVYETVLTERFGFSPFLKNKHGLPCKSRPTCTILVYEDQAPQVELADVKKIDDPETEKVEIAFHAEDDFGIEKVEIVVTEQVPGEEPRETTVEVPLDDQSGNTEINKTASVDLGELDLQDDSRVSVAVRVTDNRDGVMASASLGSEDQGTGEQPSGEQPSGEQPSGEQPSGEQPSGEQPSGEQPSGEQSSGEQPPGEQPSGEQPSGEQPSGEQPSGEQPSGEQPSGEQPSGEQPSGEQPSGEQPSGEQSSGEQPSGEQPPGEQPSGEQPSGEQPSGEQPSGEQPSGEQPSGEQPSGEQPSGEQPSGEQPSGEQPSGEQPSGEQPSGEQPSGEQPSGEQPSGEQPSGEQPSGEQPSGEQPSGEQPSDEQPSGEQPSDEQPSGEQPSGEQPSDEQPSGEQPSDEQPSGEQPSGEQPSGSQSTDTEPIEIEREQSEDEAARSPEEEAAPPPGGT